MNDTLRAAREMRRLHEQMTRRTDYLAPRERSWTAVWRSFHAREFWTAIVAFIWLGTMWLAWISK